MPSLTTMDPRAMTTTWSRFRTPASGVSGMELTRAETKCRPVHTSASRILNDRRSASPTTTQEASSCTTPAILVSTIAEVLRSWYERPQTERSTTWEIVTPLTRFTSTTKMDTGPITYTQESKFRYRTDGSNGNPTTSLVTSNVA